jgi:hypothetical protein
VTAIVAPHRTERLPATVSQTAARVSAAMRRLLERPGLPVLDEVHPSAAIGTRVNLGVQAIAIEDIRGTAVGGPRLRGADFKPVEDLKTAGWRIRYQRLRTAFDRMLPLPPIEVVEVGGEYWVVDGHNRVAMARETKLAFLDANVTGIRWAGGPELRSQVASLGAVLEASVQQRAAVSDRWTATSAASMSLRGGWRPCLTGCAG